MSDLQVLGHAPVTMEEKDYKRWTETRLRRRILEGVWRDDVAQKITKMVGPTRAEAWGDPDLSSNPFRTATTQLSVLYDRGVTVSGPSPELIKAVEETGLWELMQRIQRDTLGLREMLLAIDAPKSGGLNIRPVYPDMVKAAASVDDPDRPVTICELCMRSIDGMNTWVWDLYDISDPAFPSVRSFSKEPSLKADKYEYGDLTQKVWGGFLGGESYPWRYADGTPFLPYILHHAQKTGKLFDYTELSELVEGTLLCAVYWTYFGHVMRQASWPQRWMVGLEAAGSEKIGPNGESQITTDPTTVFQMQLASDAMSNGQFSVGQWNASSNPVEIQDAVANYERRVAAMAGISPADIQRVAGDPRSGHAIAITKEAQRESQRRFEPQFQAGDEELLRKAAAMLGYPEDGWSVTYHAIPLTAEESSAVREDLKWQLESGLLKKEDAWLKLNPGKTPLDAELYLKVESEDGGREYPVGYVALIPGMLAQVQAGQMSIDNLRALLVTMMGLTPEQAAEFK